MGLKNCYTDTKLQILAGYEARTRLTVGMYRYFRIDSTIDAGA